MTRLDRSVKRHKYTEELQNRREKRQRSADIREEDDFIALKEHSESKRLRLDQSRQERRIKRTVGFILKSTLAEHGRSHSCFH